MKGKKEIQLKRGDLMAIFGIQCDNVPLIGDLTHGYLWLGGSTGPCFATIDGLQLRKLYGYLKQKFEPKRRPR